MTTAKPTNIYEVTTTTPDWRKLAQFLVPTFAARAAIHDRDGSFVSENYQDLKSQRWFSALVPAQLGGAGARLSEIADALRILAHGCASTALSLAMHTHLIGTTAWKWRNTGAGELLLRRVPEEQLVLVSTGANDWLESNGTLERVDGGYRFSATKRFASGSPGADYALTSAPYNDPERGWRVLHFAAPLRCEGVTIVNDWDTLGMRGTGSNSIKFDQVFIPTASIALDRQRGAFHPFFAVVSTVALPIIMSVYLGVAERARDLALEGPRNNAQKRRPDELTFQLAGELEDQLTACRVATEDMVRLCNDGEFRPSVELANSILARKTIAATAAIATVEKALELSGGGAFYRTSEIERLLRDVHAVQFHPLPAKPQCRFTGRVLLGLDPVNDEPAAVVK